MDPRGDNLVLAELAKAWAAEAAGRVARDEVPRNKWTEFVRRIPAAYVVDELTVFFYDVVWEANASRPLIEVPGSAGVEDWSSEHFSRLLKRVMLTTQVVASSYEVQRASQPDFVSVPTEVYEEFLECRDWAAEGGHLHGILRVEQERALLGVQEALFRGVEHEATAFFTEASLQRSSWWAKAREAAGNSLRPLGIVEQ